VISSHTDAESDTDQKNCEQKMTDDASRKFRAAQ
jgi:hypothetical protein